MKCGLHHKSRIDTAENEHRKGSKSVCSKDPVILLSVVQEPRQIGRTGAEIYTLSLWRPAHEDVDLIDLVKSFFQRVVGCKRRFQYTRERALLSLPRVSQSERVS